MADLQFSDTVTIAEFMKKNTAPATSGVYKVLYKGKGMPDLLAKGTGGTHEGKDLNYDVAELKEKWVEGVETVYIGKAKNLHERLQTYMRFGQGKDASHRGGRAIWQIADSQKLLVCWAETDNYPGEFNGQDLGLFRKFLDGHYYRAFDLL
ncbi:MAG: hypothetical protein LBT26_11330 [Clostridiales Family XIII bacterium]|jgi:hypothetical protein|nr:hypothetical protein [Clostridiales Family XIII bacterium]